MPIHHIKMIAFDIDGTLFTSDEQVTLHTRQAIQYLRQQGKADFISKSNDENGIIFALQHFGII
jgi:hydroxymethylpyrimidine pyrophosphatase-like HAD family hydrolase